MKYGGIEEGLVERMVGREREMEEYIEEVGRIKKRKEKELYGGVRRGTRENGRERRYGGKILGKEEDGWERKEEGGLG